MLRIVDIKGKPRLRKEVAELYSEIFSEKPWSENFRPEEVMMLMSEQFDGSRQVITLASIKYGLRRRKVVGFSWMYEIFKNDLKEGTRYAPALEFLFKGNKKVFYLQEIATKKEYRRRGIGERVIKKLLGKGKKSGANFVVLSTNTEAEAAKKLFSKTGFKNSGIVRPPSELNRTYWILGLQE